LNPRTQEGPRKSKLRSNEESRKPTEHAVPAEGERLAGKQHLLDTVQTLAAVQAVVQAVVHTDRAAVDRKVVGHIEAGR
jgi:hypothetical protein